MDNTTKAALVCLVIAVVAGVAGGLLWTKPLNGKKSYAVVPTVISALALSGLIVNVLESMFE